MWAPGAVGLVVGLALLVAVKDSPEKIGYPPVEIVKPKVPQLLILCIGGNECNMHAFMSELLTDAPCPLVWSKLHNLGCQSNGAKKFVATAEARHSWSRAEGVPLAAACTECPQEPLHLGHGIDIFLHLCCTTGCYIVVCVLPDEGMLTCT